MSEIKRLKIEAKEILFQNGQKQIFEFFKLGLLNVIPTIIYFVLLFLFGIGSYISNRSITSYDEAPLNGIAATSIFVLLIASIFLLLFQLFMLFIQERMYLKLVNEKKFTSIKDTISNLSFNVFLTDFAYVIVIGIVVYLINLVFSFIPIVSLLVSFYISMTTCYMMYYRYLYKEAKFNETIKAGYLVANGRQWTIFKLQLSFIPWILLGCITFGIGFIWITPYIQTTNALFFTKALELENDKINETISLTPLISGKKIYNDNY